MSPSLDSLVLLVKLRGSTILIEARTYKWFEVRLPEGETFLLYWRPGMVYSIYDFRPYPKPNRPDFFALTLRTEALEATIYGPYYQVI